MLFNLIAVYACAVIDVPVHAVADRSRSIKSTIHVAVSSSDCS